VVSDGCAELAYIAVTLSGWGGADFNPTTTITPTCSSSGGGPGTGTGTGAGPALAIESAAVLAWMSQPHPTVGTSSRIAMALSQVPLPPTLLSPIDVPVFHISPAYSFTPVRKVLFIFSTVKCDFL